MASSKSKKKEYLNATNAAAVANSGLNAAWTQGHNQFTPVLAYDKNGNQVTRFVEGTQAYGTTRTGKLGGTSRAGNMSRSAAKTHTFTPKNDDGTPVLGKNGKPRQSGRSQIASYSQRRYDVIAGLNNVVGEKARQMMMEDLAAQGIDVDEARRGYGLANG